MKCIRHLIYNRENCLGKVLTLLFVFEWLLPQWGRFFFFSCACSSFDKSQSVLIPIHTLISLGFQNAYFLLDFRNIYECNQIILNNGYQKFEVALVGSKRIFLKVYISFVVSRITPLSSLCLALPVWDEW